MTDPEFDTWLTGYLGAFPDFKKWFLGIEQSDRTKMVPLWRQALADIELRDAKAVTLRISAGDDDPIPAYERELTAAHIRKRSKENRNRRSERSRKQPDRMERTDPRGPSAGQMYRDMLKLMDDHPEMTGREAAEQVIPAANEQSGRRYECPTCLDSGIVLVWSQRSIRAAVEGKLDDPNNRRSCGAPCNCRLGETKVWSGDNPPKTWAGWLSRNFMFTHERYCQCPNGDTVNESAIADLKDWAAERLLVAQTSKRTSEFDQFNRFGAPV